MSRRILPAWLLLTIALGSLLAAFSFPACGPGRQQTLVIGSKNFTEQVILGEMLAQHLEAKTGLHVERRFYLAGTYICHQALLAGRIDAYVEYTGTALTAIMKQPVESDPGNVYDKVKREYASRFDLEVMDPLGFNNTFAIVDPRRDRAPAEPPQRSPRPVPMLRTGGPGSATNSWSAPTAIRGWCRPTT